MKTNRTGSALAALGILVLVACTDQTNSGGTPAPAGTPATALPALTPTPDPFHVGLTAAESLFDTRKAKHVAIVAVSSNGHVFPAKLVIHKKVYYVVWIPDGEKLEITFTNGTPPPVPDCRTFAPACVLSTPIQAATPINDPLRYEAWITKDGVRTKVDPHLEVVK